jgi:hypothetical protein
MTPNYQVQRRATAALARGRDSDRVRNDAERPRHALYASPVRCNAELGGTALGPGVLAGFAMKLVTKKGPWDLEHMSNDQRGLSAGRCWDDI